MFEVLEIRRQQQRLWHLYDGLEEFSTTMEASEEEYDPEVSTTTTEALAKESEETTRPSEHLRRRKRRCVYGLRAFTTTAVASAE